MKFKILSSTGNEIIYQVREPGLFIEGSTRYYGITSKGGLRVTAGKLKDGNTLAIQSFLFDKINYTDSQAKDWLQENGNKTLDALMGLYKEIDISGQSEQKIIKYIKAETSNIDELNHTARHYISTEDLDRDKEIILLSAWKKRLSTFKQHPIMLSSHNYQSLQSQIGESLALGFDEKGMYSDTKWYADEGNKEADWAWNLAKKKKAMFSVGFIKHNALEGDAIPEKLRAKEPRRVYTDTELLEFSQVVIGSNRGALQMGYNPTAELCEYAFDVVKSFGNEIPDYDAEPAKNKVGDLEVSIEVKTKEKINNDSTIFSPVQIKDMAELNAVMEIWKSGRVISQENKTILKSTRDHLQEAITAIDNLLKIDEPKEEPKTNAILENEIKEILARNRDLLNKKS